MKSPNLLILMADQMQGRVLDPESPCITPNLDKLADRGIRFKNAYSSNAVCSPARAGIMTGLLPHNHGVLTVTHCTDKDQSCLRTEYPHWAQRLQTAGYDTAYFGKWHVENTESPGSFGWNIDFSMHSENFQRKSEKYKTAKRNISNGRRISITGYDDAFFYGVTDVPPEERTMGIVTESALEYLNRALEEDAPWCCVASVTEPHDPFICGREAYEMYDPDALELPPNFYDNLENSPGLYSKTAAVYKDFTDKEKREAMACYYASITEIDSQFGRILDLLENKGELDNTIVIFTSDHGELLGAHRMYCKNFSAYEEVYNIPMIFSGPGIEKGAVCKGRVGSHDLCPTILDILGLDKIENADSNSFVSLLKQPGNSEDFQTGYAEYFGTRFYLTQRVLWNGPWKYVFNGFDFDELYNLEDDPFEMENLAKREECRKPLDDMAKLMWEKIKATGDHVLLNSHYPPFRFAPCGPLES